MKKKKDPLVPAAQDKVLNGVSLLALDRSLQELYSQRRSKNLHVPQSKLRTHLSAVIRSLGQLAKSDDGLLQAMEYWDKWVAKISPREEKPVSMRRSINGVRVETLFLAMKVTDWLYENGPQKNWKESFDMITLIKQNLFRLSKSPKGLEVARALWDSLVPANTESRPAFLVKPSVQPDSSLSSSTTQLRNGGSLSTEELDALRKEYQMEYLLPGATPQNHKRHLR